MTFALRVVLGSLFIFSSVSKLPQQLEFIDVVTSYNLLPNNLAYLYGSIVPWAELVVGCLLIIGLFSRYITMACILMVASFIVANGTAVYSIESDPSGCGCFGGPIAVKTSDALIIDIIIFIAALQIVFHKGNFLDVDSLLHPRKS